MYVGQRIGIIRCFNIGYAVLYDVIKSLYINVKFWQFIFYSSIDSRNF